MSGPTQSDLDNRLPEGVLVGGRYQIDGFLARGGFATVYRAHHAQIGRKVAIKVLERPGRADAAEAFKRRFLQEAQIAALIDHAGVVDVFDFGVLDDGRTFIAMDLLEGHDLEAELKNGPMLASRLVPLFIESLAALHEGHRQGIVHKDLKPSNLFLVKPGQPGERLVILDFGIARMFEDPGSRVTQDGGFSGTPAYLAPEYIRHQIVSPALDVYQMGLILIEVMTGTQAIYSDNSMGYLLAHCLHPPTMPKSLLDSPLGEVCLRALSKDPELRYQDAGEFRAALADIPRDLLRDTVEIDISGPLMGALQEDAGSLAKTMQFIMLTSAEFQQLQEAEPPPSPPPMHRPKATASIVVEKPQRPPAVLWGFAAFAAVVCVVALLAIARPAGEPAADAEPVIVEVDPRPPPELAQIPTALEARVPDDAGHPADAPADEADAVVFVDSAAEPVDPPEPESKPRPRPRPETKPKPEPKPEPKPKPKPTAPLLLSP